MEKLVYLRGKQDASYWSGLIAYQRGNYPAAVDYFARRTLEFMPDGPWTDGARYNLARTFEAAGEPSGPFCSTTAMPARPAISATCCGPNG